MIPKWPWMIKGVTHAHLEPICYHSEPSDIPYSQTSFLVGIFFAASYSKADLVIIWENSSFSTYLKTASNLTTPLQTAVHCKINCGIDSNRASNKLVKIANDNIINFEQLIESPLRQRPRPRTTISYWTMQLNNKNINCLKVEIFHINFHDITA